MDFARLFLYGTRVVFRSHYIKSDETLTQSTNELLFEMLQIGHPLYFHDKFVC